jgi:hypothetical protein
MAAQHTQHTLSPYINTKVVKQAFYSQFLSAFGIGEKQQQSGWSSNKSQLSRRRPRCRT